MGGSKQDSQSTSKPLSGGQRKKIYDKGLNSIIGSYNPENNAISGKWGSLALPNYEQQTFISPGSAQTLTGGDYDALQQALYAGSTAGLDKFYQDSAGDMNQGMSDRGIWSSGIAEEGLNDLRGEFAASYTKAGADAAAQRYGMQANELAQLNQYNQNLAAMENQFNQDEAGQVFQSQWTPMEYLMNLWNGTQGQVATSKADGLTLNW